MRILPGGLSLAVMTAEEEQRERRRRGYWLRLARLRANLNQNEVARRLGLSERSGTTVLAWEQGRRDPRATVLHRLARLYGVPPELFIDPPPTDEERLEAMVKHAEERERADWERVAEPTLEGAAVPGAALHRRSA
jgi:transcriptional regulator with XRE-family HTH domain